jgi:hypothetical protein
MITPRSTSLWLVCLVLPLAQGAVPAPVAESPAWSQAKVMLTREGELLDIAKLLTPAAAERENFCAIPNLRDLAIVVGGKPLAGDPGKRRMVLRAMGEPFEKEDVPSLGHGAESARRVDLVAWARYLAKGKMVMLPKASAEVGASLLEALDLAYPALPHLARAGACSAAVFTPAPAQRGVSSPVDGLPTLNFPYIRGVSTLLSLRALAAIQGKVYPEAVLNVAALHKLTLGFQNEPNLVGQMQAIASSSFGSNAAWHLLEAQGATEEQLRVEQAALDAINFSNSLLRTWRCEMAIFIGAIEATEAVAGGASVARVLFPGDTSGSSGNVVADLLVTGPPQRVGEAKAAYVLSMYEHCIKPLKAGGIPAFLAHVEGNAAAFQPPPVELARTQPGAFIGRSFLRQMGRLPQAVAQAQMLTDQARVACALERFLLVQKRLPGALAELVPQFLAAVPADMLSGKAIGYRPIEKARYILWSVGLNRQDEGGAGDDLVWGYEPKAE